MADNQQPRMAELPHQPDSATPPLFHPDHAERYLLDRVIVHIRCRPLYESQGIKLSRVSPLPGALAPYAVHEYLDGNWDPHIFWSEQLPDSPEPHCYIRQWPGQVRKRDGQWMARTSGKSGSVMRRIDISTMKYLRHFLQSQGLYDDGDLDQGIKDNYLRWSRLDGLAPIWLRGLQEQEVARITIANLQHMPGTFNHLFGLDLQVDDFKATTNQIDIAWDAQHPDAFGTPDLWFPAWHRRFSGLRTYRADGDWMSLGAEPNGRKKSKSDDAVQVDREGEKRVSDKKPVWLKMYPKAQDVARFEAEIKGEYIKQKLGWAAHPADPTTLGAASDMMARRFYREIIAIQKAATSTNLPNPFDFALVFGTSDAGREILDNFWVHGKFKNTDRYRYSRQLTRAKKAGVVEKLGEYSGWWAPTPDYQALLLKLRKLCRAPGGAR